MENKTYKFLAISFLLIIFSVGILFIVSEKKEKNEIENRQLSELPKFNIAKLDPFPRKFDIYFTDHFPFRNEIIKKYSEFSRNIFNISPMPDKVVTGKDGWLYMVSKCLEGFQGKSNFSNSGLESIKNELEYRINYCSKRGIKYYFVILPHKATIYPEFIPLRYKSNNKYTPRTQLTQYLTKHNIPFIDVTDDIIGAKSKGEILYKKTDNHWNELGAFYGTKRVLDEIRKDFKQTGKINLKDYNIIEKQIKGGNLAQMLNLKDEYDDINIVLEKKIPSKAKDGTKKGYKVPEGFPYWWDYEVVKVNPDVNSLKVLIIRESFTGHMIKFYQEAFGKTVFIFDAWEHKLNEEIIKSENPDIVIQEVVESFLPSLLFNQSRPK
jgi:hypothetical protein